jgi:AraC family transcriptional regulator
MITKHQASEATLRDYKTRILRVLVHLQQHLDEAPALEELAAVACFSPFHFHRIFHGMIGETVAEHVRRLRLERAASRLKLTTLPVTQIAFDAGYEAHEAFTRAFKSAFGVAPVRFRDQKGSVCPAGSPSGVHYRSGAELNDFKTTRPGVPIMKVQIQSLEPMRVAFMRHVGPYDEVGATWDKLLPWLGKEGWLAGEVKFIGVCHDDPDVTPPDKIRYDACVTVDARFTPAGDIGVQTIPGGEYAMTTHFGPYHKLGETYTQLLGQWLPRSGRQPASTPCFEIYLNSPDSTEPEDLITDIYAPLQPKRAGATTGAKS